MKVYAAINAVQRALSISGIEKNRRNTQGSGYNFRGIDDVYNAIAPLLAEHGLCIVPRFLTRVCEERQSKAGGALFYVTVEAEFDFISSEDGSKHTARTFGEAMDSGDKATNKAMSAAYKYAAFQTFAIPTEGNPDADAETHQVKSAASILDGLRSAAMEGTAALKIAYTELQPTDALWKAEGAALKLCAQKVDQVQREKSAPAHDLTPRAVEQLEDYS